MDTLIQVPTSSEVISESRVAVDLGSLLNNEVLAGS